jgi:hypothetical protein
VVARPAVATALAALVVLTGAGVAVAALGGFGALGGGGGIDRGPARPVPAPAATRAPAAPATTPDRPAPPTTAPAQPDWPAELTALDDVRRRAFTTGAPALLEQVYAPGSAALETDRAALRELSRRGIGVEGYAFEVEKVRLRSSAADRVVLRVTDRLGPHRYVDRSSGAVVARDPGRGARNFDIALQRSGPRWLIASITAL